MISIILDWLDALLRWAHIMAGIAWIGSSFFFIWLDLSLRKEGELPPGVGGETWMVHGGGFFLAEKYKVAPERMPDELHWFKYEAYFTLITGLALLVLVYYLGAEAFLIDRDKVPLDPVWASFLSAGSLAAAWFIYDGMCRSPLGRKTGWLAFWLFVEIAAFTFFYHGIFSDRAAFLHVGAMIGTIMASSVFFVIIPNQKKVVADLKAGRKPDPALGMQAGQRSLHNNYLTLPVIFFMVSNHYPAMFGHPWSPFIALGVVIAGALIRHYFNVTIVIVALIAVTAYRPDRGTDVGAVSFADVEPIMSEHCVMCHSEMPTHESIAEAPGGVAFDTPEDIRVHAESIKKQTVLSDIMPLGNETGMTDEERALLGAWIDQGAPLQ